MCTHADVYAYMQMCVFMCIDRFSISSAAAEEKEREKAEEKKDGARVNPRYECVAAYIRIHTYVQQN